MVNKQYYCKTCNRTMDDDQFYASKRLDRYPNDGKFDECKKCLTRHVDNWTPRTYMWILEAADVPYMEEEWSSLLKKFAQDRNKVTGMTILGRYLSKMKLKQFRDYCWDDTEKLRATADQHKADIMAKQGYTGEEIEQALAAGTAPQQESAAHEQFAEPIDELQPEFFNDDLTDEDKKYLSLKWGRTYKPFEWVQLEQYYVEMMEAYDIQTPSHIDYLKLICKTSLKAHQLIDLGDVEGFQKMSKVYDTLMKSAKFTAAQDKNENGEFIDSISQLALLCEKEGFIPRYYIDKPNDKVDETLKDMRGYAHNLITEEMNLGNLIENALRTMKHEEEKEEDDETDDVEIDDENLDDILTDEDFEDHSDFIEDEINADQATYEEVGV